MGRWRGLAVLMCLWVAGCFPRESQHIGAIDPLANIPAIQQAARDNDYKAIPALIGQLDSDDGAVRFYAIVALHKLTGQTFDYHFYDDTDERKPAIARWKQWSHEQTRPTPVADHQ